MRQVIYRRPGFRAGAFEDATVHGPEFDWAPPLDIFETPDRFLLVVSLPGVGPDDVEVSVDGRTVTVAGERLLRIPAGALAHLLESRRGHFMRRVVLPHGCDTSAISSELRDGQLVVSAPRSAADLVEPDGR